MGKKTLVLMLLFLFSMIVPGRFLISQNMIITKTDGSWERVPVNEIEHIKFQETGTATDYDGKVYKTVKIGNQWWMAENLKTTHYRNGEPIADCWAYSNIPGNGDIYGLLYSWHAVSDSRNIAPIGWHIPSDDEWKELERALGMAESELNQTGWRGTNVGSKLSDRADLWADGALESDAAFGFSGFSTLPAGYRGTIGEYAFMGNFTHFWSASECSSDDGWNRGLFFNDTKFFRGYIDKEYGFSVRCVKD